MKMVIRRGVFETNSSSTHSLSLQKTNGNDNVEKGVSFEIRSRDAKIVMLLALIENAELEYSSQGHVLELEVAEDKEKVRKDLINMINSKDPSLLEKYKDKKKIPFYDLSIILINNNIDLNEYFTDKEDLYLFVNYFVYSIYSRTKVLRYKDILIKEFAKLENISEEEAMDILCYEANSPSPLKRILKEDKDVVKKIEQYMKKNKSFKVNFEKSGEKDVVKFAKDYLLNDFEKNKKNKCDKFYCSRYFGEGCLYDCDCGFQDYDSLDENLNLSNLNTEEELEINAREFLSDKYKLVAQEYFYGEYLSEKGDIF